MGQWQGEIYFNHLGCFNGLKDMPDTRLHNTDLAFFQDCSIFQFILFLGDLDFATDHIEKIGFVLMPVK